MSPANKRSWAIWDEDKNMARVERKVGKFDYGCKIGEHLYLDYYETLFLLEMVSEGRNDLQKRNCGDDN